MSFLRRLFGMSDNGSRNPAHDHWWGPIGIGRQTTQPTPDTVIQIPEVYDCLSVLSQSVAQLPFFVFKTDKDGSRTRLPEHPVTALLGQQANMTQETTAFELRAQMTWDAALHRNAYAEIRPSRRAPLGELIRFDPSLVQVRKSQTTGEFLYEVHDGMNKRRVLPEDMLHMRTTPLNPDNLTGRSLIQDGYRVFSRALEFEDYIYRTISNDAQPGGVVEYEGKFKTKEEAMEMRSRWQETFSGRNKGKVAVLDNGAKYNAQVTDHQKLQLYEMYKEIALQLCRLWRMPPHKVGLLDKATFSNIEQQALEFVVDTLMPWIVMWEQAIKRDLLFEPGVFAHHNVAGLLRGDLKSRYESYAQARNWGWLSVNDIRRLENLNPVEHGDTYLQPLNMVPAGTDTVEMQRSRQLPPQQPGGALASALETVLAQRLLPPPSGD